MRDWMGMAFHCHHRLLAEFVYSFNERLWAIRRKPENEVPTRLRLFKKIPPSKLPPRLRAACHDLVRLDRKINKLLAQRASAELKLSRIKRRAPSTARYRLAETANWTRDRIENELSAAFDDRAAVHYSYRVAMSRENDEIVALHKTLCGCKEWNGEEIVFPVRQNKIRQRRKG